MKEKIQHLTKEINEHEEWKRLRLTPFHLTAKKGHLPVCQQIMENNLTKIGLDQWTLDHLHFPRLLIMVTCQFVSSLLMTKISNIMYISPKFEQMQWQLTKLKKITF